MDIVHAEVREKAAAGRDQQDGEQQGSQSRHAVQTAANNFAL
jgi:hypothetical protein